MRENIFLLASSLFLGLIFDFLFYGKPFGISYPLFILAFYAVTVWNLKGIAVLKLNFGGLLSIPVILLSLSYLLFSNRVFGFLNFIAVPVLIIVQMTLITGSSKHDWHAAGFINDILYGIFCRPFADIPKPFQIISGILRRRGKKESGKYDTAVKVVIGLLISAPLILIIVLLLSSADQVFNSYLGKIPDLFANIRIEEIAARIVIVSSVTLLVFSYIWSFLKPKARDSKPGYTVTRPESKSWDPVVVATILVMVNIIYVFFVFIQFTYLFGSLNLGLPSGFTYAEYARRGFFELIAVTLINFSILLSCLRFVGKGKKQMDRVVRILYSLLVVCTLVMLFSAHFRMSLYEEAYGYTYLRMLTHTFMVFLFVLFVIAVYRVWNERVSLLKPYIVAAIISYLVINYINIDVIIARNNINRYYKTGQIDVSYLTQLSYDVVPELVVLLDCKDDSVAVQVENYLYDKKKELAAGGPWQSFNVSKYRSEKALSKHELVYTQQVHSRNSYYQRD